MHICEWCLQEQEDEDVMLISVVNQHIVSEQPFELVCPTCAELAASEHLALWTLPIFNQPRHRGRRSASRLAA